MDWTDPDELSRTSLSRTTTAPPGTRPPRESHRVQDRPQYQHVCTRAGRLVRLRVERSRMPPSKSRPVYRMRCGSQSRIGPGARSSATYQEESSTRAVKSTRVTRP